MISIELVLNLIVKYKKYIVIVAFLLTIIGIIVYYFSKKDDNNEYFLTSVEESITNTITNEKEEKIKVHISGEVLNPGVIEIEEGARIIDAINLAGGLTEEADINKINLAYVLEDAMKVYIPSKNDDEFVGMDNNKEEIKVNINTANEEELQKIPGIGFSIASKIISYRKQNGKFKAVEDIKNIGGIGDSKFENIKNYLYIK